MLKKIIYEIVSHIPEGKISTYGDIAEYANCKSPRVVGNILHQNPDPNKIYCHRVVNSKGCLSMAFAFGGREAQEAKLRSEGLQINNYSIGLDAYRWQPSELLKEYFKLYKVFGDPGPWPWFNQDKPHTPDEIIIGAILTQNTNWNNVQKAIEQLRVKRLTAMRRLSSLDEIGLNLVKEAIRCTGFYNQKLSYLLNFAEFYDKNKSLINKLTTDELRHLLLAQKGIGQETADTIILYVLNRPIFVVDTYTKRYCEYLNLPTKSDYQSIQFLFQCSLPGNVHLFKNYHALIVQWAKKFAKNK